LPQVDRTRGCCVEPPSARNSMSSCQTYDSVSTAVSSEHTECAGPVSNVCTTLISNCATPVYNTYGAVVAFLVPAFPHAQDPMSHGYCNYGIDNLNFSESSMQADVASCHSLQQGMLDDVNTLVPQGQVWNYARTSLGCRVIQEALENAASDSARVSIVSELRGHVWDALQSPHANHVLQKCISTMRVCDSQFILDEIMQAGPGAVVFVAEHQFGCRILQRFLEHSTSDQSHVKFIDEILTAAIRLSKHNYGSFLMQHLIEYGSHQHTGQLLQLLTHHASSLASDMNGVAVLGKALTHASDEAQKTLADALASQPSWLVSMSSWRQGYQTAKLTLQAACLSKRDAAIQEVQKHGRKLQKSRYGRKLLAFADNILQGDA